MSQTFTNQTMTRDDLKLHNKVLDALGWGPRIYEEDEYGEEHEVEKFIDFFKDHLKFKRLRFDFSRHAQLSTYDANVPQIKNFEDALFRARNFELARILGMTEACLKNPVYRMKFLDDPCFNGTVSTLDQATNFFISKYNELETKFTTIMETFHIAHTKEDYLNVFDQMLDLRYGPENRRPKMRPWECHPQARIHPNDLGQFEEQTWE